MSDLTVGDVCQFKKNMALYLRIYSKIKDKYVCGYDLAMRDRNADTLRYVISSKRIPKNHTPTDNELRMMVELNVFQENSSWDLSLIFGWPPEKSRTIRQNIMGGKYQDKMAYFMTQIGEDRNGF